MTPTEFQKINKLYHYTKFENAKSIIKTNSLKFGRLNDMNDVYEAYKHISDKNINTDVDIKQIRNILMSYMQLSFTQDGLYQGYDISAMWGHYAQKGKGVCLVFDKDKLISALPNGVFKKIDYKIDFKGDIIVDSHNLSESIECNIDRFFFTKSKDWEYEQEFRIIQKVDDITKDVLLSLKDSLIAIIIQYADDEDGVYDKYVDSVFNSQNFKILDKISNHKLPILEYSHFYDNSNLRDCEGNSYGRL